MGGVGVGGHRSLWSPVVAVMLVVVVVVVVGSHSHILYNVRKC